MLRRTAIATLLASLALGCDTGGDDPDTDRRGVTEGPLAGHVIEFALDPEALGHERAQALAKRIEEITAAESIKIRIEKTDEGGTVVVAEAWGRTGIAGEAIVKELRASMPELANAVITVNAAGGEPPSAKLPGLEVDADDDDEPGVVRQRVIDKLRADGVEGDVKVDVEEDEDGKRQIRVELKHEEQHPAPKLAAPQ